MPVRVSQFQPTPNPNAIKCVLEGRVSDRIRSYMNAGEAAGDPLGARLFAIPGVTNVLIHPDWITVSKNAEADWAAVRKGITAALDSAG